MTIEQANEYFSSLPEGFAPAEELRAALPAAVQQRGGQQIGIAQIVQSQLHGRVSPCSEKINA